MTSPTLLLLHGLGASAGVWTDLRRALDWDGRVVVPDLPGHGAAEWSGDYTVGALAAAISSALDPDEETIIVGHSLGGGVALCLASGFFRPEVRGVIGLGIKVVWTDDDVAGMAKVADRGIRWFDERADAIDRAVRVAGLDGLVSAQHPAADQAITEEDGRWRIDQDPATFVQKRLDMAGLMAAAHCPIILGAGADDASVSAEELALYVDEPRIAPGCGHNVQVQDPAWVVSLLDEVRS